MRQIKLLVLFSIVILLFAGYAAASGGTGAHWGYDGNNGPAAWGGLSPEYRMCGIGQNQSPINIAHTVKVETSGIVFDYRDSPMNVLNNGHTIQVNYAAGSYLSIGGKSYTLLQLHFHSPSENNLHGQPFAMEAHLVHKDAKGNLAVVGVFLREGDFNPVIQKIWNAVPEQINHVNETGRLLQADSLLPSNHSFFHFMGSLTTPPCSESVKWYVMKTPIQVSREQVENFSLSLAPMPGQCSR